MNVMRVATGSKNEWSSRSSPSFAPLSAWRRYFAGGRRHDIKLQIVAYTRLARLFSAMGHWEILTLDESAADQFKSLRRQRVRIGSMDLKIASVALAHDATLITANSVDFSQVPGLRLQNWLMP